MASVETCKYGVKISGITTKLISLASVQENKEIVTISKSWDQIDIPCHVEFQNILLVISDGSE